jgi:F-type H+-transporting ATPase subunit epsilon
MALKLRIVTPEEQVELEHLKSVVFQTAGGEVGILPGHVAMICRVDVGVLTATAGESRRQFVTGAGLARVCDDLVIVLLHELIAEEALDRDAAERALSDAEAAAGPREGATDLESRERNLLEIRFAQAQLALLGYGYDMRDRGQRGRST